MANSHYELIKARNGQYHFILKAGNGETLLTSEMYASKASAENGILSVQNNVSEEAQYEIKPTKDGQFYFVLKAKNHQVIAISEMYTAPRTAKKGVLSVIKNGLSPEIRDLTQQIA